MEHPPYSPDLVPHDIWLFSKVKSALNVWRFQDTEDIQKKKCDGTESYSTICVMMSKLFLHKQRTGLAIKLLWSLTQLTTEKKPTIETKIQQLLTETVLELN
jgi:hypothetical protein